MEILHTMRDVSTLVSETLSKNFVNQCCSSADISFESFVNKAKNLEGHFPKFDEIYQMSTTPSLWSDLFSIECNMLCNKLLLNTNIDIAKAMSSYVSRGPVDKFYAKRMELLAQIHNLSQRSMYNKNTNQSKFDFKSEVNNNMVSENAGLYRYNSSSDLDQSQTNYNNNSNLTSRTTIQPHTYSDNDKSRPSLEFVNRSTTFGDSYVDNADNGMMSSNMYSSNSFSTSKTISIDTSLDSSSNANSNELSDGSCKLYMVPFYVKDSLIRSTLFSIISNLTVYNERLNVKCLEDRRFYEKCCKKLFLFSEDDLLNRPEFIKRSRGKVLQFLKQLSRTLDIDKCTHNLSILFFDCYLNQCTVNSAGLAPGTNRFNLGASNYLPDKSVTIPDDYSPFTENEMLKIGTACYLLAGALREHWVDINKDKYLEQAIEMSSHAFTTKEVVAVQLDVLHRMPKGFTSIYTCMEYGLFFLANIKYINFDLNTPPNSTKLSRLDYFDDFMFFSSSFNFLVQTGSLCWIYHCLSKWDDLYVAKNWNRFIPPSRCAAVLIFHFFVSFFSVDFEKDLIWCRRFCHRVFRMFFDSDVSLWYFVFRENIRSFLVCIEKSSDRMQEMSSLFGISSNVFRAIEAFIYLYHTKVLLGYFFDKNCPNFNLKNEINSLEQKTNLMKSSLQSNLNSSLNDPVVGNLITSKSNSISTDRSMDLDSSENPELTSNNKTLGLDYEKVSLLFSNLIDILQKS